MLKLSHAAALAFGVALSAQSPLTTTFASNNGGSVGGGVYFNLTVNPAAGVNIGAMELNLGSAVGTPGTIQVWTIPGTHVGFENSNAGWTQVGTGSIIAAGLNQPSRVLFSTPLSIAQGTFGVAICYVGVSARYTTFATPQTFMTAELSLTAGSALNTCFGAGTPFSPRVFNGRIFYGGEVFSRVDKSGAGCNTGALSFYELFPGPGGFDLANSAIQLAPAGGGYAVTSAATSFVPPTGTGLALTDDSVSAPLPLGFTLNFPSGSTTDIKVCSNGFIHLNNTGTSTDFSPTVTEALTGGPRLFPMWGDLIPDGTTNTNNVYFETGTGFARVTWLNVPEYGNTANLNTMQVTFNASGVIDIVWQTAGLTLAGHPMLVGFSPGASNRDPGNRDISTSLPFVTQGSDIYPLTQDSTNPVLGTTATLTVSNITAGSVAGVEMLGNLIPGIDLTFLGMPTCSLYLNPVYTTLPFATGSSTATVNLPIPTGNNLLGAQITVQAATITPGANSFGALSSNAATLSLGNY